LTRQFILRSEVLLGRASARYSLQQQMDLLMQAIRLTIPQFDLSAINEFLYTFDEIKIINQIAIVYSDMEQHATAITIYQQLLAYIDKHYGEILGGSGLLPMVLHNYARELDFNKQYEACIGICEKGRRVCIQYANYQFFPGFLALMAESYHFAGKDDKSKECYLQAYYLYRALGNEASLNIVRKEAKEYLGLEFEY
jgi:tetratricopeptide (TPR) repeat protein